MAKLFSSDFMLGAATAAHQVEGNNVHSDFWAMEHMPYSLYKEPSLQAVDHYHHYHEDIQLLVNAGLNTYRFSIEWARIEPVKGQFNADEIEHYRKVLECCHQNKVNPVVTLHHFSSPKWLITEGDGRVKQRLHISRTIADMSFQNWGNRSLTFVPLTKRIWENRSTKL